MTEIVRSVRVCLPYHLRNLARSGNEITLEVVEPVTIRRVLDVLESNHPVLRGTIRDQETHLRRPFLRFFACEQDLSHDPVDELLPASVLEGREPLLVIGAIAGG